MKRIYDDEKYRIRSDEYTKMGVGPHHKERALDGVSAVRYNAAVREFSGELFNETDLSKLNQKQATQLMDSIARLNKGTYRGTTDGKLSEAASTIQRYNRAVIGERNMANAVGRSLNQMLSDGGSSSTFKDLKYDRKTKVLTDPNSGMRFKTKYNSKTGSFTLDPLDASSGKATSRMKFARNAAGKVLMAAGVAGAGATGYAAVDALANQHLYKAIRAAQHGNQKAANAFLFDAAFQAAQESGSTVPFAWYGASRLLSD